MLSVGPDQVEHSRDGKGDRTHQKARGLRHHFDGCLSFFGWKTRHRANLSGRVFCLGVRIPSCNARLLRKKHSDQKRSCKFAVGDNDCAILPQYRDSIKVHELSSSNFLIDDDHE